LAGAKERGVERREQQEERGGDGNEVEKIESGS